MDRVNMEQAKRIAKKEDWSKKLPLYDKECEDDSNADTGIEHTNKHMETLSICKDSWDKYELEAVDELHQDVTYKLTAESLGNSQRDEMGSLEDLYLDAGTSEKILQDGGVSILAKSILSEYPGDVREVGEHTVLVDLSFLKSSKDRRRVAGIIEAAIKAFSPQPELINSTLSGKRGGFKYYMNPECSPMDKGNTSSSCVVKYGSFGITPELISKIKTTHPDTDLNEVIVHSLKRTSKGKKIINLYNLPL